ncbi:hypothetical protein BDP55DRAFT_635968 [Colletotrichum godetiae]|uniref:Uncharacterized protein n=1 Tax=Colletotrichum godetiae TaxID=1209918 RepID=A0AAJ0ACK4_9PEZI|nr:uncharacterized protein BDP55DRAFT_635968 [Colletotrichum godetiae]KAK1671322.1 hypothetical protein BDP55DRAFT_635968 [Colletotrichum godetiae]
MARRRHRHSRKGPRYLRPLFKFPPASAINFESVGGVRISVDPDARLQVAPCLHRATPVKVLSSPFLSSSLSLPALDPAHENACPDFIQITAARDVERASVNRDLDPVSPTHGTPGATRAGGERVCPETQPPRVRRLDTGREVQKPDLETHRNVSKDIVSPSDRPVIFWAWEDKTANSPAYPSTTTPSRVSCQCMFAGYSDQGLCQNPSSILHRLSPFGVARDTSQLMVLDGGHLGRPEVDMRCGLRVGRVEDLVRISKANPSVASFLRFVPASLQLGLFAQESRLQTPLLSIWETETRLRGVPPLTKDTKPNIPRQFYVTNQGYLSRPPGIIALQQASDSVQFAAKDLGPRRTIWRGFQAGTNRGSEG